MVTRRAVVVSGGSVAVAGVGGAVGYRLWRDREPAAPADTDAQGRLLWRNWSGIQWCYPQSRVVPAGEDELAALLKSAPGPIRAVGAGHSFTALVPTAGTLVSLDRLAGVIGHDAARLTAKVRAGTRLGDLGPALAAIGQEMPNLPDINKQSLGGALGTATHGTGRGLRAIHGEVVSFRLATAAGEIVDCSRTDRPEVFDAARVNLGAFGVVSEVVLQNRPLARIRKVVTVRDLNETLEDWPRLKAAHRNVEFYAVPFTGKAAVIAADPTDAPVRPRGPDTDAAMLMDLKALRDTLGFVTPLRRWAGGALAGGAAEQVMVDEGWKLLSNERPIRFNEMEYHFAEEAQIAVFTAVLAAIETHRPDVFFPIEVRSIAADDAWLSPFFGRESGSVAVHAYYKDDYRFLFDLIEPIFRRHGGRPHWGKLHSLTAADLAALYPRWTDAMAVREGLDPGGRLLNPYLRRLLIRA